MLLGSSLAVASRGCSAVVLHKLVTVVASLVADIGSRVCGLSSCGMWALGQELRSCDSQAYPSRGIQGPDPGPGVESTPPAWRGGLPTTESPGNSFLQPVEFSLPFTILITTCLGVDLFVFILFGITVLSVLGYLLPSSSLEHFLPSFYQIHSLHPFVFLLRTPIMWMLICFMLFQRSLKLFSLFSFVFLFAGLIGWFPLFCLPDNLCVIFSPFFFFFFFYFRYYILQPFLDLFKKIFFTFLLKFLVC